MASPNITISSLPRAVFNRFGQRINTETISFDSNGAPIYTSAPFQIQIIGGKDGYTQVNESGALTALVGDGNALPNPGVGNEYVISVYLYPADYGTGLTFTPVEPVDLVLASSSTTAYRGVYRDAPFHYDTFEAYSRLYSSFKFRLIAGAIASFGNSVSPTNPYDGGVLLDNIYIVGNEVVLSSEYNPVQNNNTFVYGHLITVSIDRI